MADFYPKMADYLHLFIAVKILPKTSFVLTAIQDALITPKTNQL